MRLPSAYNRWRRARLGGIASAMARWSRPGYLARLTAQPSSRNPMKTLDRAVKLLRVHDAMESYRVELLQAMRERVDRGRYMPGDGWICGALCRSGERCASRPVYGMRRCRMHGGASTGPKTAEGRARSVANLRRGPG